MALQLGNVLTYSNRRTYFSLQVYHPLPIDSTFVDVSAYIEQLPTHDNPDLFGMDANAEKAYLELQASEFVSTILSVQPRLSLGLVG